jgi:hypothetical protein
MIDPPAPFVVCHSRSGSTLLRLMLDSHSQLAIPAETHFCDIFEAVESATTTGAEFLEKFVNLVVRHVRWPDFALREGQLREALQSAEIREPADAIRTFYRCYARQSGKDRWGDKTPSHLHCYSRILRLLPEARVIFLVRDGRDVACSMAEAWFGSRTLIETYARDWARAVAIAGDAVHEAPDCCQILKYEQLVCEPEVALRRICAFIRIDFEKGMLGFSGRAADRLAELGDLAAPDGRRLATRAARIAIHSRASEEISTARIGRWRAELTPQERSAFEAIAGGALAAMNYR